jgi:hypothetical protein
MKHITKIRFRPTVARFATLCVTTFLSGFLYHSAFADDPPFEMETGHWMSFDHYKDADSRGILSPAPKDHDTSAPIADTSTITPPASTTPPTLAVASPTRPIDLPVMPGLNKGFTMRATSTEEDNAASASVINADASSTANDDIHLTDKNWQSPASTGQNKMGVSATGGEGEAPLAVRLSFLPDSKIMPTPTPDHESAQQAARLAYEIGLRPQPQAAADKKAQPAVCAAIDAYKKQQLTAIQSDRETLKALQDAIAALGLQKQLGFMTSSESTLGGLQTPAQAAVSPLSPSTTIR